MLDTDAIERLVRSQIEQSVNQQVTTAVESSEWLESLERRILEFVQARVMAKFSNAQALPEIEQTVRSSVQELFRLGTVPGISQYVDQTRIQQVMDLAIEQLIESSMQALTTDPVWLEKIERQIEQQITHIMVDRVVAHLGGIDLNPIIKQRIDENMTVFRKDILEKFSSTGIDDQATVCQLTVMDDNVVVENHLTARDLNIFNAATIQDLVVTGSVNIDNPSWNQLADGISDRTLTRLSKEWHKTLVSQVADEIRTKGIDFDQITMAGQPVIQGTSLTRHVTDSSLQTVGILKSLQVQGETHLNNTVSVLNRRLGVNTQNPEMALSIWDEEVSVIIGKHKAKQAYIGTSRDSGVAIGVNRVPHIEIDTDGLTTVKKLRVGLHRISHDTQVPGWSGTRGDIVFNASPGSDRVFAWVCTGAHRWQTLKSAE
jgi:hypothetical protein